MRRWSLGQGESRAFEECIKDKTEQYITRGYYAKQLHTFLDIFQPEQLHIIDFEDYVNKNAEVMDKICDFLELPRHTFPLVHAHRSEVDTSSRNELVLKKLREHYEAPNAELKALLSDIWGIEMSWLSPVTSLPAE
jgi:hypothetical protein